MRFSSVCETNRRNVVRKLTYKLIIINIENIKLKYFMVISHDVFFFIYVFSLCFSVNKFKMSYYKINYLFSHSKSIILICLLVTSIRILIQINFFLIALYQKILFICKNFSQSSSNFYEMISVFLINNFCY